MNLLAELRRRSVFRVAAAYLISGWVVMQVVALIAGASGLPEWTTSFILMLLIAGLPIALIVAWAFEMTPEGVKQTETGDSATQARPFSITDGLLLAGLAVVIGFIGWQQLSTPATVTVMSVPDLAEIAEITETAEPAAEEIAEADISPSIAVMPFVAISAAPQDVVLGDGLAEELLNVLAQFPDLSVAGRTSSFSFRDRPEDITGIGEALGVSHVLEGSVRRSEEQIRVTAQLIRVADGFHIWSGTYDRPFTDILEVQDDIVRRIAQVLTIRLGASAYEVGNSLEINAAAYEQYLRGRVLWAERHVYENRVAAIAAFQTAVDIDPNFADAWAALARSLAYSGAPDGFSEEEKTELYRQAAETALELDPGNAEAMVALSNWHVRTTRNWVTAKELTDRAMEIAPNAAYTHYNAVLVYEYLGDETIIARSIRRAIALDPLNVTIVGNSIERYIRMERLGEARRLLNNGMLPRLTVLQGMFSIAFQERDAEAIAEIFEELRVIYREENPEFEEADPHFDNLVQASIAALENNEAELNERMPMMLETVELEFLTNGDIADVLYLIGNYAAAAGQYRMQLELGQLFDDTDFFATNTALDVGFLCQPDYHIIWEQPGMPELADIRRSNGATGNLPLSGPQCDEWLVEVQE